MSEFFNALNTQVRKSQSWPMYRVCECMLGWKFVSRWEQ